MKALRNILGFLLIMIIISGLGYIGWFLSKGDYISWPNIMGAKTAVTSHNQHSAGQESQSPASNDVNPLNELQRKVSSSYKSIQQAAELMSAYPYAGSANITANTDSEAAVNQVPLSSVNPSQIQRFQRGVYSLSEGVYLMNQLDQNLKEQIRMTEASSSMYQVYVNRYNLLVQDKTILSNVYQKMIDAKELFLSNLSVSDNKAIYQMAQAVMELESANLWVDNEIQQTQLQVQQLSEAMKIENEAQSQTTNGSIFGTIPMPSLITMITILFTMLLLVGLIGIIRSLIVTKPNLIENDEQTF